MDRSGKRSRYRGAECGRSAESGIPWLALVKTACWEKKTRSLSRPWSTRLNLGKFFRRSGTMTLSATFLTWGNSRAVLLLARTFAAYCGKRRKMACERYKEFSQQGIFDHGVGRARARLEWEAFCQSPCLQGFGGDSLDEWVERRVGWRLRAWSLFACAASAVCRSAWRCSVDTRMV